MTAFTTGQTSPMYRDPRPNLPLHAELFLLAHDDDTGTLLINEQVLAFGLAGGLLLELARKGHLAIGYVYHDYRQEWQQRPGRLTVRQPGPTGSALLDAALTAVQSVVREQRSGDQLRACLRSFAVPDLYERVRAELVAVGLLHRVERRRLAGLIKSETYLAVHYAYAVRARANIRDAVSHYAKRGRVRPTAPADECVALCGLVAALELTEFLYDNMPTRELTEWLWHIVITYQNPTVTAVAQAVDAGRGDLAVAAMR